MARGLICDGFVSLMDGCFLVWGVFSMLESLMEIDRAVSRSVIAWVARPDPGPFLLRGILAAGVGNPLVKGAVPAAVFWYLWFRPDHMPLKQARLVATLIVALAALVAGRILQTVLPFRQRPRASGEVMGADAEHSPFFEEWSSLPSDHAVMFFALAGCVFLVSRPEGVALFLHAALLVCAARVAFGLHYLGDVVAGAVIGTAMAFALMPATTRWVRRQRDAGRWRLPPQAGYPLLFLVTFQFATMFDGARDLVERLARFLS